MNQLYFSVFVGRNFPAPLAVLITRSFPTSLVGKLLVIRTARGAGKLLPTENTTGLQENRTL